MNAAVAFEIAARILLPENLTDGLNPWRPTDSLKTGGLFGALRFICINARFAALAKLYVRKECAALHAAIAVKLRACLGNDYIPSPPRCIVGDSSHDWQKPKSRRRFGCMK